MIVAITEIKNLLYYNALGKEGGEALSRPPGIFDLQVLVDGDQRLLAVLVTGTSLNEIGFEIARAIDANLVIITGYSAERLKLSKAAIKENLPLANIRCLTLDFSSLAAVRKAAAEILIHNAAAALGPFKPTVDNLENQIATNHCDGHSHVLASKLLASRTPRYTPRVVFVSSGAQAMVVGPDFRTFRHPDAHINAYSMNPGVILTSMMQKGSVSDEMKVIGVLNADGKPNTEDFQWKTRRALLILSCQHRKPPPLTPASTPGAYLEDSVLAELAPHSSDLANAKKLWTLTEIIGEKFTF
ncbi:hypothetical protein B0H15DRAFT_949783 [Mycena belliarum]|uniref:Uncharacterized protein n=1 Tax=Mycena belliarum TaxID=1033014 RepID=A0AAD6XNV5_9AGAR|nr:hypothetical protein B0H15DRAFT_949783 [Mycena belliae]